MLKYTMKHHSKYWPGKWRGIDYLYCKHHLDFNKFKYKDGHKTYSAPSKAVNELFNKEKEQFFLWRQLTE